MTFTMTFAQWLALREAADAAARAIDLIEPVRRRLAQTGRAVIHDLGSGTGSMGRWLAPQLPGPQHWIMYDQDPELLEHALAGMVSAAADGSRVAAEARCRDITRLTASDLDGASLITASALLDMLTAEEIERVADVCATIQCPTLFTISVIGRVELDPADHLDDQISDAFNAHQRRTVDGRTLLGPDAVDATIEAFKRRGVPVQTWSSPWRLGPDQGALAAEWFTGWLGAACEQQPRLTEATRGYARRRLADAAAGRLEVVVYHTDLLAGCD